MTSTYGLVDFWSISVSPLYLDNRVLFIVTSFMSISLPKKEELAFRQALLTRKRYSTLYSTPSLAEAKHTRSSYSSRDERQTISLSIVYSKIMEKATISKIFFTSDIGKRDRSGLFCNEIQLSYMLYATISTQIFVNND